MDSTRRLQREPRLNHHRTTRLGAGGALSWRPRTRPAWVLTLRTHARIRIWPRRSLGHLVGRNPAGSVKFRFDLLSPHFLRDIRDPNPKQADGGWSITGLVIYGKLDFIRLIDLDIEVFFRPFVRSGGPGSRFYGVFDLDDNESFRTSREAGTCCMVDILNGMNAQSQETGEGLAHVRGI